jgi:hypothetical protein
MHQETIVIGPQYGRRFGIAPMRLDQISLLSKLTAQLSGERKERRPDERLSS